jgi:hypothetical protein
MGTARRGCARRKPEGPAVGSSGYILIGIVAPATMRVVPVVGVLPHVIPSAPTGVQDDMSITDGADMLLYRGQVGSPRPTWCLVDRCVSVIPPDGRTVAGVGPAPS